MKNAIRIAAIMLFSLFASHQASADACPAYSKADLLLDNLYDSWDNIYYYYKNYGECMDGYFGEGVTDAVVKRLATHWDETSKLIPIFKNTPEFESFVLYNINSSADENDLLKINEVSKNSCPENMSGFCKKVEKLAIDSYNGTN